MAINATDYYNQKAAQLNQSGFDGRQDWTVDQVQKSFADQGLTPESHYEKYGKSEGLTPSTKPDTRNAGVWSDDKYLENKTEQVNRTGYQGRDDWTAGEVAQAISDSGMDIQSHYKQYGFDEGVDPYTPAIETLMDKPPAAKPELYNVDPNTMTVQGQMEGLLSSDSQYINLARQQAAEQANSRGLLNSSIAASAGQRAAIESALPIAQQDAQTYFSQSNLNQNAENNFALFNKEFEYNDYFADQKYLQQQGLNEQQNAASMDLQRLQDTGAMDRTQIELDYKRDIADMENAINWEQIDAENRQAFTEATGKLGQQYIDAVKDIQTSRELDAYSKDVAINNLKVLYRENMQFQADIYDVELEWDGFVSDTGGNTAEDTGMVEATPEQPENAPDGYTLLSDGRYRASDERKGAAADWPTIYTGTPVTINGDTFFDQGNGFLTAEDGTLVTRSEAETRSAPPQYDGGGG